MNTEKKHSWAVLRLMCAALLCSTIFIACSESKDSDEPDNPDVPVTPVKPGDYQNVPVTGGTIEKGDISIEFPAGTFDADTKVAITEVKKGEIGGKYEASPFYQLTLPMSSNKPFSVKMKAEKTDGEIAFVVRSPGFAISLNSEDTIESAMETSNNGGVYTTTIPAFDVSDSDNQTSIIIGLGRVLDDNESSTKAAAQADKITGVEGNVKWELIIEDNWAYKYYFNPIFKRLIKAKLPTVKSYIEEAIKTINGLGFHIPDTVTLNYRIREYKHYGAYCRSALSRSWDRINLKDSLVMDLPMLRQTIIHETLHNYQSYYLTYGIDPYPRGENLSMYEIGAVWIEKFVNGNKLNGYYQLHDAGLSSTYKNNFRVGLSRSSSDIKAMYSDYDEYGYALAPLLYYMISKNYSHGFDDTVIYPLYNNFWGKMYSSKYTLLQVLDEWYDATYAKTRDSFFNGTDNINNYYLSLWKGELMNDFEFTSIVKEFKETFKIDIDNLNEKNNKLSLNGKVYPYGCEALLFTMDKNSFKDSLLNEDEMIIKQEAEGLKTYLLYSDGDKIVQYPKVATKRDSITISGTELDALRKEGVFNNTFFLLTVRENSSLTDTGTIPSKESVEVRKANYDMKMTAIKECRFGCEIKVQETKTGKQSVFSYSTSTFQKSSITQNGTTVHIELTAKEQDPTTIYQWDRSLSFDIINFSADAFKDPYGHITSKIKNFHFTSHTRTDYPQDWSAQYKYEDIEISGSNMEPTPYDHNRPGFYYFGGEQVFAGKTYHTIESFFNKVQTKDRNRDAVVKEYTLVDNPDNIISLDINYDYVNVKEKGK